MEPNAASQIRVAFSSMAWNTGSSSPGELEMTCSTSRRRGLLRQRFAQLMRALLDLLLQAGVGFLQPPRHVVELVGQHFELVAGLDRDALLEIAGADLRRAFAQPLDRHDHLARQEQAGEERQRQAADQQPGSSA